MLLQLSNEMSLSELCVLHCIASEHWCDLTNESCDTHSFCIVWSYFNISNSEIFCLINYSGNFPRFSFFCVFFHYNSSLTQIIQSWWCASLSSLQQQHIHCFHTAKEQGNCTCLCTDPVTASWPPSSLQTRVLLSSNILLRSLRNVSHLKNH